MTGFMIRNKTTGLFYSGTGTTWLTIGKLYPKVGQAKTAIKYHDGGKWLAKNVEVVEVELNIVVKATHENI